MITPADPAERAEAVSLAVLGVLETLTPLERAVFVLHEVFEYAHPEIAEIVGRTPAAVRQLAHRAREHVRARRPRFPADPGVQQDVTQRFVDAVIAALLHWKAILPGMARADVPESWLTFPIGTLKTAGAAGLLAGLLLGVPWLVAAAATGLVLFFVCALFTHVRASDYTAQFGLAVVFLGAASASLVLTLTA